MLNKPFSGKELFLMYEKGMDKYGLATISEEDKDELWDITGKTKKQTYNNMAKEINDRMRAEKGEI
jgi:hypothetical protein